MLPFAIATVRRGMANVLVSAPGPVGTSGWSRLGFPAAVVFAFTTLPGPIAAQTASGLANRGLIVRDGSLTLPGPVQPGIDSQGRPHRDQVERVQLQLKCVALMKSTAKQRVAGHSSQPGPSASVSRQCHRREPHGTWAHWR